MLLSYKIQERFPLTEDGWAKSWMALVRLSPDNAAKVEETLRSRAIADRIRDSSETSELDARSIAILRDVALLGGYAPEADMKIGGRYDARFLEDRLIVCTAWLSDALLELPYAEIEVVEIGGPGLVKSGGGFIGGGFGAVGALEGMAVAGVLNALTTRTSVTTVVRVQTKWCELFLLHAKLAPEQLRIHLSRPSATPPPRSRQRSRN